LLPWYFLFRLPSLRTGSMTPSAYSIHLRRGWPVNLSVSMRLNVSVSTN
jgi:hypothetical protein